eukprot:3935814-Rhodomonas_salina.1
MAVQEGCAVTSLLVQGNSARAGVYLPTLSSYNITPSYRPLCGTDVGYGVSGFGGGLYVDSCFQPNLSAYLISLLHHFELPSLAHSIPPQVLTSRMVVAGSVPLFRRPIGRSGPGSGRGQLSSRRHNSRTQFSSVSAYGSVVAVDNGRPGWCLVESSLSSGLRELRCLPTSLTCLSRRSLRCLYLLCHTGSDIRYGTCHEMSGHDLHVCCSISGGLYVACDELSASCSALL